MAAGTGTVTAAALVTDMVRLLGEERVFHKDVDLKTYTYDSSFVSQINNFTPEVVVMPGSTEEVSRIMRYADEHGADLPAYLEGEIEKVEGTFHTEQAEALGQGRIAYMRRFLERIRQELDFEA